MRLIASSLLAGLIAVSAVAPAFADQRGRDRGRDRDHDRRWDRGDRDHRRDGWRDDRRGGRDWDDRRDRRGWYDSRGSHHHWKRGDYFHYRPHYSNYVVVDNYRHYRLPPPRYGQHYYRDRDTGEILLIAAATGLVLWALTN